MSEFERTLQSQAEETAEQIQPAQIQPEQIQPAQIQPEQIQTGQQPKQRPEPEQQPEQRPEPEQQLEPEQPKSDPEESTVVGFGEPETGEPEVVVDFDSPDADGSPKSANPVAAAGKVAIGTTVAAVGVPMLVLPGPGLAAIAVGGLVAAKGVSELTGKENPVITQIEDHPEYQSATQKAKDATGAVADAAADAAKQVPGIVASAGKAVLEAAHDNLPENVRDTVDRATPKIKSAADAAAPVIKGAADAAAPVVDAVGKGVDDGLRAFGSFVKGKLKRR